MEISLFLCENLFGAVKPEIIDRLQAVIDNPNQETWEDAHCIIVSKNRGFTTLWQAIYLHVDYQFQRGKGLDAEWDRVPTSEEIIKAIKTEVGITN